jgi:hypothetical protein
MRTVIDYGEAVLELTFAKRTDAEERKLAYEKAAEFRKLHACQACGHTACLKSDSGCPVAVDQLTPFGYRAGRCGCGAAKRVVKKARVSAPPQVNFGDLFEEEDVG